MIVSHDVISPGQCKELITCTDSCHVSCSAVFIRELGGTKRELFSHMFFPLTIDPCYLADRDGVWSIIAGTLIELRRQSLFPGDGVPPPLANLIYNPENYPTITVATLAVPEFENYAVPRYGLKAFGLLSQISPCLEKPSAVFHFRREICAVHTDRDPVTQQFQKNWSSGWSLDLTRFFIILFVEHPPVLSRSLLRSTAVHSPPSAYERGKPGSNNSPSSSEAFSTLFKDSPLDNVSRGFPSANTSSHSTHTFLSHAGNSPLDGCPQGFPSAYSSSHAGNSPLDDFSLDFPSANSSSHSTHTGNSPLDSFSQDFSSTNSSQLSPHFYSFANHQPIADHVRPSNSSSHAGNSPLDGCPQGFPSTSNSPFDPLSSSFSGPAYNSLQSSAWDTTSGPNAEPQIQTPISPLNSLASFPRSQSVDSSAWDTTSGPIAEPQIQTLISPLNSLTSSPRSHQSVDSLAGSPVPEATDQAHIAAIMDMCRSAGCSNELIQEAKFQKDRRQIDRHPAGGTVARILNHIAMVKVLTKLGYQPNGTDPVEGVQCNGIPLTGSQLLEAFDWSVYSHRHKYAWFAGAEDAVRNKRWNPEVSIECKICCPSCLSDPD